MVTLFVEGSKARACFDTLHKHDVDLAVKFQQGFNRSIYPTTCTDELETLNRYWRSQVSRVQSPAIPMAYTCLTESTDFGVWLANFERHVIPVIVFHRLPH